MPVTRASLDIRGRCSHDSRGRERDGQELAAEWRGRGIARENGVVVVVHALLSVAFVILVAL